MGDVLLCLDDVGADAMARLVCGAAYSEISGIIAGETSTEARRAVIGMDWGTSNVRAYRFDGAGAVAEERRSADGMMRVGAGGFAERFEGMVGDWLRAGEARVLLCGMVGSRGGWVEAGYVGCPAGIEDLAREVVAIPFPGAELRVVPGVRGEDAAGVAEVMRGEETEVMGVEGGMAEGLVCLPGTHTKWVEARGGRIVGFRTCMTGDVFGALGRETILARTMEAGEAADEAAFVRGVERSAEAGGLLHHLFGVRAMVLTGGLQQEEAGSYLSGLLIGHEVRSMLPVGGWVRLVGAAELCKAYGRAIAVCGGGFGVEAEGAAARGMVEIGRRLGWI